MRYYRWDLSEIENLEHVPILAFVFVEINESGRVVREIGTSPNFAVQYRVPGKDCPFGSRGLFDLAWIDIKLSAENLTASEFEVLWKQ